MRVDSIEGFVLHARDYRDTSQLVDIFTLKFGRVRLVAKGTRSQKKNSSRLSPFTLGHFSWTGRSELKTLTQFEAQKHLALQGENLICGFYLNELLWHLLQPEDSHPDLYLQYKETLEILEHQLELEPLLRGFELNLLDEVGYGISFEYDTEGDEIRDDLFYSLSAEQGWCKTQSREAQAYPGETILGIHTKGFENKGVRSACKRINRTLIDSLLEGRKLNSRELIGQKPSQEKA